MNSPFTVKLITNDYRKLCGLTVNSSAALVEQKLEFEMLKSAKFFLILILILIEINLTKI